MTENTHVALIAGRPYRCITKQCEVCGKDFSASIQAMKQRPGRAGRFCSKACRGKWQVSAGRAAIRPGAIGARNLNYRHGGYGGGPRRLTSVFAHTAVHEAVQAGKLVPQPCEQCGRAPTQAHHDDYKKPLEVRWLCVRCHSAADMELRRLAGVKRRMPLRFVGDAPPTILQRIDSAARTQDIFTTTTIATAMGLAEKHMIIFWLRRMCKAGSIEKISNPSRFGPARYRWL